MTTELTIAQPAEGQQLPGPTLLQVIAAAAADPRVDVTRMQQLLDMAQRERRHEAESAFNRAMRAAQAEIQPIVKDAKNEHLKTKYATLERIDRLIRPIYTKHGFAMTFNSPAPRKPGAVRVACDVLHDGGHSKAYELEGELDLSGSQGKTNKTPIQALGSSTQYLRRYLTLMIWNLMLLNEDDDGQRTAPVLDKEQREAISLMIADCRMTTEESARFFRFAGAPTIDEIFSHDYDRLVQALRAMLKKQAEGQR